jgi:hypothetical protein
MNKRRCLLIPISLMMVAVLGADPATYEVSAELDTIVQYRYNIERPTFADQVRNEAPVAQLRLGYEQIDGASILIEASLQREWVDNESVWNVPNGVDGNPVRIENNAVTQGYVALPVGAANLTFGRQKIHIGPDRTDSLSASNRIPFYDALVLELPLGGLTMTSVTSTMENRRASPDVPEISPRDDYGYGETIILYNIHYFSYAWDRIQAGIGSQVIIARENNTIQFGDLFPVFSWHNADITPNNMCLIADAEFAVTPELSTYVQFGFDDISGSAVGVADGAIPTISAILAGAEWNPTTAIQGRLQTGYTHYLWGMFDDDEYLSRAVYRWNADSGYESMPLTSPWGPGVIWVQTDARFDFEHFEVSPVIVVLGRKPVSLFSTPYGASDAIEAAAREWSGDIRVEAAYRVGEIGRVSATPGLRIDDTGASFLLDIRGEVSLRTVRRIER